MKSFVIVLIAILTYSYLNSDKYMTNAIKVNISNAKLTKVNMAVIEKLIHNINDTNLGKNSNMEKYSNMATNSNMETNSNNKTCKTCIHIVEIIEYELKVANKTINDIIALVEDLCKIIGGPAVYAECKSILKYIREIINWLIDGNTPTQVCEKLGACKNITKCAPHNKTCIMMNMNV